LLATFGGVLGIVLATQTIDWLYKFLPRTYISLGYEFKLDPTTLLLALAASLLTGILFGFAPAAQATRLNQVEALKDGGRGLASSRKNLLRSGFVIAEIALALVLLVCAGLAWQSFQYARQTKVGLDPNNVLLAGLRLESHGYDENSGRAFIRKLKERLEQIGGVESVAAANWFPLGFEGGSTSRLRVPGYVESTGEYMSAGISCITPDYFRTLRIPVLDGRDFQANDDANASKVAIINEEVAKRYFKGRNPIGVTIDFRGEPRRVVGVVQNGKYGALSEPQQTFIYLPLAQVFEPHLGFALRASGNPYAYVSQLRAALKEVDPAVQSFTEISMVDFMGAAYLVPRIASTLLLGLSAVALFLAVLGIYGVTSYVVSQRTREIGIRMALGATLGDVYKLILQGGFKLALIGIATGLALSLASTRLMSNILIGIKATDPFTFIAISILLLLVALLASFIPAHRASRVDPNVALRYE
jgi:predicted permease